MPHLLRLGLDTPVNAPGSDLSGACPDCGAGGLDSDGRTCPACHGTGLAHPRHDFDH